MGQKLDQLLLEVASLTGEVRNDRERSATTAAAIQAAVSEVKARIDGVSVRPVNGSLAGAFGPLSPDYAQTWLADIWGVTVAQIAPIMPYVLLVLILIFRPMGLLGTRET